MKTSHGEVLDGSRHRGDPVYKLLRKIGEGEAVREVSLGRGTDVYDLPVHPAGGFAEIYLAESLQRQEKVCHAA